MRWSVVISDAIMEEVGKVLRGDKFRWPEEEIAKAQRQIARLTERVQPTETLNIITADPPDNRILECAAAAQAVPALVLKSALLAAVDVQQHPVSVGEATDLYRADLRC